MSASVPQIATEPAASHQQLLRLALDALDQVAAQHWRKGPAARFARKDTSAGQMHVLMLLREFGPVTIGQLAEILAVSMPSVSSLMDRLEEHGLVERQRAGEDRRQVHVVLTPKGAADAEEAAGFRRDAAERVLSKFTDAELQATLQVMGAVQRTISCLDQPL